MSATKRENELELEVWRERFLNVQTSASALNIQGQLLQLRAKECQDNITRLEGALKAEEKKDDPDPPPAAISPEAVAQPPA